MPVLSLALSVVTFVAQPGVNAVTRGTEHESDVYAIGGIDEERMTVLQAYKDRIAGIAAIRLFQEAPDPRATAARVMSL